MKKVITFSIFVLLALALFSCKGTPPPPPPPPRPAEPAPTPPPQVQDTEGPVLGVQLSCRYFSPDGDGVNDILTITLSCKDQSPIDNWSFDIREPNSNLVFYHWEGKSSPPASLTWDGKSSSGELVQSASDYPYEFKARDIFGNASSVEGIIEIDILVIRDGNTLRVQVPSIMFPANSGRFAGLDPQISAANDYVLRRIAVTLNKFSDYKVRVEGHANPTATTPAAQQREQAELQTLSEQRARTVVDYLVNLGVARDRLTPFGIGASRPIVSLQDQANWWKNRRVEFILVR